MTAPKHFQPASCVLVADVAQSDDTVPITVSTPAVTNPRLIGAIADLSLSVARTANTPTIDASTPMARAASGKIKPEHRVGADRLERRDAEDDRRDERDLVALEEVGGHAGAVADVVAHVVGDRRRVAGVVLGDALLDLADEVGADVGGLGEDAATDADERARAANRRSRSR